MSIFHLTHWHCPWSRPRLHSLSHLHLVVGPCSTENIVRHSILLEIIFPFLALHCILQDLTNKHWLHQRYTREGSETYHKAISRGKRQLLLCLCHWNCPHTSCLPFNALLPFWQMRRKKRQEGHACRDPWPYRQQTARLQDCSSTIVRLRLMSFEREGARFKQRSKQNKAKSRNRDHKT